MNSTQPTLKSAPIIGPRRHQFITPDKGTVLVAVLEAKEELGRLRLIATFCGAEGCTPSLTASFSLN